MKVPFIDLKPQNHLLKPKLLRRLAGVLESSSFILGKEVDLFEREFTQYCGVKFGVGVNSGTDALFLALLSLGIGSGDEVICPVYSYIASALSISYTGARPVFVDIDKKTFNISVEQLRKKITKKTKAVIAVHLYGQPADMKEILKIASAHNLRVIEDAAQAHGALTVGRNFKLQKVGSLGDIGCFSFYPTKNLSACGDAGIVVTNNKNIYKRLLMLRDQGRRGKNRYLHYLKGYNSRLDSFQAAILSEKLKSLDKWNEIRRRRAHLYTQLLRDVSGIIVPDVAEQCEHVYHIYAVLVKKRNKVLKCLYENNIQANVIYHLPLHLQSAYDDLGHIRGDFPVAEMTSRNVLCLPMHSSLAEKEVYFVAENLKKIMRKISK